MRKYHQIDVYIYQCDMASPEHERHYMVTFYCHLNESDMSPKSCDSVLLPKLQFAASFHLGYKGYRLFSLRFQFLVT